MFPSRLPRHPLLRSSALPVVVTAGLLLLVLIIQLISTHRSLGRFAPLQAHLAVMQQVHEQILSMQRLALEGLDPGSPVSHESLARLNDALGKITAAPALLSTAGLKDIQGAQQLLRATDILPAEALQQGIALLHQALAAESRAHDGQLRTIRDQARLERDLALAALIVIPIASLLALYLQRQRFLRPLANLNTLLTRLGERDFAVARMDDVAPMLEPLFANYNRMVRRIAALEAMERAHREELEASVRVATRDLLAHNRSLAEADRLATLGEMAASLAHELRNPLAGMQIALANLRHDLSDEDARQRLDLVAGELKRVTDLLNSLLNQTRHQPEAAKDANLLRVVEELAALARFQIEPHTRLVVDIPPGLHCTLPENRLRQALLNLVLNATQAMPAGGEVRIAAGQRDGQLTLTVSDSGPGFPAEILSQGLRPFATGRAGGTGLGLASVRRLALDLGGVLKLDNPGSGGGRVTLLLPCPTPPN